MTTFYHWTRKDKAPSIRQINLDTIAAAVERRKKGVKPCPPGIADYAVRMYMPSTKTKHPRKGGSL